MIPVLYNFIRVKTKTTTIIMIEVISKSKANPVYGFRDKSDEYFKHPKTKVIKAETWTEKHILLNTLFPLIYLLTSLSMPNSLDTPGIPQYSPARWKP